MLRECRSVLANVLLQPNVIDHWVWRHDPSGGYTVRGDYSMLAFKELHDEEAPIDMIWHKQVPLKVSVLAWRLLRNRLPTKDNLVRRHILPQESSYCVAGSGGVETAHHLFLACPVFAPLWSMIRSWVGFSSADPLLIRDHFVQFILSTGVSRARRLFMQLLWLCAVWVIWQERNNRIFKAKETYVLHLLDKVKVHSLWWMKSL
jgi:hypothetical protein